MTRKRAAAIVSIISAALFAAFSLWYTQDSPFKLPAVPAITPGYYRVVEVIDGDTIRVDMSGKTETIRFIGVDTPETKKPNSPVQCFGPEASDFTKKLLSGKSVRLEADAQSDNRDRYGRLLRYVYTQDNSLVESSLITGGYAFAYLSFPFDKKEEFAAAQKQAQDTRLGLWAKCTPKEASGRWQSNDL